MVDRQQLAEAWQGWLGPLSVIVVGLVLVGLRYFEVIPDGPTAIALTGSAWGLGGLFFLSSAWRQLPTPSRKGRGLLVFAVGLGASLWVPFQVFGPDAVIAKASLAAPGQTWTGPSLKKVNTIIDVFAVPTGVMATLEVSLGTGPGAKILKAKLSNKQLDRRKAGNMGEDRHRVTWTLPDEVFGKPLVVSAKEETLKNLVRWPVKLVVRRGLPPWPPFVGVAIALLLLGATLDRHASSLHPTYLATYGASAGAFGPMLASMYQPDAMTRSVFFALFLSLFAGAFVAALVVRLVKPKPSGTPAEPLEPNVPSL